MKLILFGKNAQNIEETVKNFGFEVVEKNPDVVISYGGDGTLLSAEREFPGVPKLPIRDSLKCVKCSDHTDQALLQDLKNNALKLEEYPKLTAHFADINLQALNDIVIRNATPIHAIRFNLTKNDQPVNGELIIGDGLVFSTAFGSTGYFKSVTKKSFNENFAVAFNNTTEQIDPVSFTEGDKLKVAIIRGPATLSEDNNPALYNLDKDAQVEVHAAEKKAQIYELENLRCSDCKVIREKH